MTLVGTAIVVGVLVLTIVGSIVWVQWSMARTAAKLHAVPRAAIGGLAIGQRVRVIGRVAADQEIEAPFTGRACVAYHAERISQTDAPGPTEPPKNETMPFRVVDETGTIAIDVAHARLVLDDTCLERAPEWRERFAEQPFTRLQYYHHWEGVVAADSVVAVIGVVASDGAGGLRLAGSAKQPLVISNRTAALQ